MVVLRPQSDLGHAPPPQTPYSIITNLPSWANAKAFRDGDPTPLSKLVHLYPRFIPMQFAAQVSPTTRRALVFVTDKHQLQLEQAILEKLGIQGKKALMYLNPDIWAFTQRHVTLPCRGPFRMTADEVELRVVDVAGHRVYVVVYNPAKMFGVLLTWGNPGIGLSIRGAEKLLGGIDDLKEVPVQGDTLPEPTWTPESAAHQGLRERIVELLKRSPIEPDKIKCTTDDVYLYPTGMAAIWYTTNRLIESRPGTIVILGVLFHNTYHHLVEESPHGLKHFGKVDGQGIDLFEKWLQEEKEAGRDVSYALVEVPGNPNLDSPDLARLKRLVSGPRETRLVCTKRVF